MFFETKPKISIIIPVYNAEKYISRCLDSVITQDYTNLEIICINDGSKDKSLAILQDYAQKDSRIIVISQSNQGAASARNYGLSVATGKYISFIDADDWVRADYLESLYKLQKSESADMVICEYEKNFINYSIQRKKLFWLAKAKKCHKRSRGA